MTCFDNLWSYRISSLKSVLNIVDVNVGGLISMHNAALF